jgi:uncharacterized membrane protein YccC
VSVHALAFLAGCKVLVGAALGGGSGALIGGPIGAAAGAVGGAVGALTAVTADAVDRGLHPSVPAGSGFATLVGVALGAVAVWSLLRYASSGRYRSAIHDALRALWRAEGLLHSKPPGG